MHRFFGENDAYSLFNLISYYAILISSLFLFKTKRESMSLLLKHIVSFVSRLNQKAAKIVEVLFVFAESYIFAFFLDVAIKANRPFGDLVGTGANYFGSLIVAPILLSIISIVLVSNPLKQIDTMIVLAPIQLFFIKLACFFNGCCWGIPWEHGPYNYHYDHPGNQVPVQLIEAFYAVLILLILLLYRKKAKPGTIYPMYLTLYSFTRFFSEFFAAAYPDVLGPFNMYQILCTIGFVVGIILLILMNIFGERLSDYFERPRKNFELKIAQKEEQKAIMITETNAKAEAEEIERKEKIRLAREKAKARKK